MPQWDMVAALTAIVIIPFALQGYWWRLMQTAYSYTRLKLNPELGRCQRLCWDEIPDCHLHRCPFRGRCSVSYGTQSHRDELFCGVFNVPRQETWMYKPKGLPLEKRFLYTDRATILAFIFLTSPEEWRPNLAKIGPSSIHLGSVRITFRRDSESGVVLVHVEGHLNHEARLDQLTKKEVECLIKGYPPFYRERINCGKFTLPSPIKTFDDTFRGGWVVGVGLSDGKSAPVPVYWDYDEHKHLRNGPFYRSAIERALERVLDILKSSILANFPNDIDAKNTVNAVSYMIRSCTQSGAENFIRPSMLQAKRSLTGDFVDVQQRTRATQQCIRAMDIFNGSPVPSDNDLSQIKADAKPMLIGLLAAVFIGVETCIIYLKDSNRRISRILPGLLMEDEGFYLESCV